MPVKKVQTGIPGLDEILDGGFPLKAAILLEAPPGTGKTTFCKQFIKEGLDENQKCMYVITSEPLSQVLLGLEAGGITDTSNILFVDGYSWRIPEEAVEPADNIVVLNSLTELNELTRLLKKHASSNEKPGRVVIDSLSDMLLYADPSRVFKFLQLFIGMVKGSNLAAVVVLEQGLHEPRHVATISYICDGTIHFKLEGENRSIYVERMFNTVHPLKWIPFTIDKGGVQLSVKGFFE